MRQVDNLLKPDLVAPGNKIVGAAADADVAPADLERAAPRTYTARWSRRSALRSRCNGQTQMKLSGTSIAAPAVAGAVALMLQANPGLTPPLIKAILQYTAQPLPGANLLQQGAGLLNVDGAVALAKALRTDLASADRGRHHRAPASRWSPAARRCRRTTSTINGQALQLVAHRLRRRQPCRQRRCAVHQVPADVGPAPRVGAQCGAPASR